MTCDEVFAILTDLLDGALDPEVESEALEHLATCERCETTLAQTRTVVELAADERPVGLDPVARRRILGRVLGDVDPGS